MNILILFVVSLLVLFLTKSLGRVLVDKNEKFRNFYNNKPEKYIILERLIYVVVTLVIYFFFIVNWKEKICEYLSK